MFGSSHGAIVQQTAAHPGSAPPDRDLAGRRADQPLRHDRPRGRRLRAAALRRHLDARLPGPAREPDRAGSHRAGPAHHVGDDLASCHSRRARRRCAQFPALEETFFEAYWRGAYDDWWDRPALNQEPHWPQHADVPATFSGGWWDPFAAEIVRYFQAMTDAGITPAAAGPGPVGTRHHARRRRAWSATPTSARRPRGARELQGGGPALGRPHAERASTTALEDEPPVRIFVMGGGGGHRTAAGPPRSTAAPGAARRPGRSRAPSDRPGTSRPDGALAPSRPDRRRRRLVPVRPGAPGAERRRQRHRATASSIDTGIPSKARSTSPWYTADARHRAGRRLPPERDPGAARRASRRTARWPTARRAGLPDAAARPRTSR